MQCNRGSIDREGGNYTLPTNLVDIPLVFLPDAFLSVPNAHPTPKISPLCLFRFIFVDDYRRFHYTFNLRDISKVFQGILMITAPRCKTVETAVRLWAHECLRVFYDRLINQDDQQWFENLVLELLPRYLKVRIPHVLPARCL